MLELRSLAAERRAHPAVVHRGTAYSGADLDAAAGTVASVLARAGAARRDRIALLFGNTPGFAVHFLAVLKLRASAVLLGHSMTDGEIADGVRRTGAVAVVSASADAARIERAGIVCGEARPSEWADGRIWRTGGPATIGSDGEMTVQFTSGVSGRPRLVARTVHNVLDELVHFAADLRLGDAAATVCPAPLAHTYGLINGLLLPLFSGRPAVLVERFLPGPVADAVRDSRARVLIGVPAMYRSLAESSDALPADVSSLQVAFSAGAALPAATVTAFARRFGMPIRQQYGTTETGVIAINLDGSGGDDSRDVGRAVTGRSVLVAGPDGMPAPAGQTGPIVVRTAAAADGYLDDAAATSERFRADGYHTGDLGFVAPDGSLVITGRSTSYINVGGLKVDPTEVERVLAAHDAILECAVVPLEDGAAGQVVRAVVVARRATSALELRQYCRARLAPHKVPRRVTFLDALPRSATGKVLTKDLIDA